MADSEAPPLCCKHDWSGKPIRLPLRNQRVSCTHYGQTGSAAGNASVKYLPYGKCEIIYFVNCEI